MMVATIFATTFVTTLILIDCLERSNLERLNPKDIKGKLYKLDSSSKILDGISQSSKLMMEYIILKFHMQLNIKPLVKNKKNCVFIIHF